MKVEATSLAGVMRIESDVFEDARGAFLESWNARDLAAAGIGAEFVQDNISVSKRHTLRGLHYQVERAQGKLVRAVQGTVFDVVVDLRRSSPTFGQALGMELSDKNMLALWIPPGLAHGFLVTSDTAVFAYKCTDYYSPAHERAIRWDDPDLGVAWPLPDGVDPLLSNKDAAALAFRDADTFS